MSVQNVSLGNGPESSCDWLNLDLTSDAVLTFPHGNSKGEEHVLNITWGEWRALAVERVEAAMPTSTVPVWTHPQLQIQSLSMQRFKDVGLQPMRGQTGQE
jgi:hypothetical protein